MTGKVMLWILIGTYFWCSAMSRPVSSDHQTTFTSSLKNLVDEKNVAYDHQVLKAKISGPNGYCLGVRDYGGDQIYIILWYCDYQSQVDILLWTIDQSDGTIRRNGKCLIVNENTTQGSNLMIKDCNTVAQNRTIWQFGDDGVITNPASGFALSSISGKLPRSVTMETDISSAFQTWHVGNDTTPSLVSITGLQGLCLQVSDKIVSVAECVTSNTGQRWLRYPDGTIRPEQNTKGCLSYDNLTNKRVVVLSCGHDPSSQRWVLTSNNNALLNERSNLVMDVQGSNPSLNKIIVRAATGDPNQRWEINNI